jgi:hypothetical protein
VSVRIQVLTLSRRKHGFESRRARQFDKKLGTPKAVSLRLRPIQRTLGPLSVGAGLIAG